VTVVHIRKDRINNAKCKTLCGKLIHSPRVASMINTQMILKKHNISDTLLNVLHNCTMSSSNAAETDQYPVVMPMVAPKTPTIRNFQCCEGCWDHPIRALYALRDTQL